VVGGSLAAQVVALDRAIVLDVGSGCAVDPLVAPHALRGGAPARVTAQHAPVRELSIPPGVRHRAELREAAAATAGGWQTFDDGLGYAAQRMAFGRPIGAFQVNRHAIAEMATWLTATEALVHDTAWQMAGGRAADNDIATVRLVAGRTAGRVAEICVQLHGGYGYTMDFDVQRAWRDTRALAVGDDERRQRTLAQRGAST
jgi:hypothetical protein